MICMVCGAQIPNGAPNCPGCGTNVQSMQRVQPVRPMQHGQPVQPVQPMRPMQQGQPVQQVRPMQQGQPVQLVRPMQQGQPVQPVRPMQQGQQVQQAKPVQPKQKAQASMQASKKTGSKIVKTPGMVDDGIMKLVALVGALMIMVSPLLSWCTCKVKILDISESLNMFAVAKGDEGVKLYAFIAIIMTLAGGLLILWDTADNISSGLANLKANLAKVPFFELIVIGVVIIFYIMAMANGDVNEIIEAADMVGKGSHGMGPVCCFFGILAAAAPRICNMLGIKLGR